jgi:hypothetical protein
MMPSHSIQNYFFVSEDDELFIYQSQHLQNTSQYKSKAPITFPSLIFPVAGEI